MKKTLIDRRTMLRGLAQGAAVLVGIPLLDAMLGNHGDAFADGSPIPVRMITWCFGNGILLNRWVPGGIRTPVTGENYPLSEELAPLVNVQEYVTVASGFHNKCKYIMTHHEGMTIFNGYTMADRNQGPGIFSNARGPTIDQVYAEHIEASSGKKPSILRGVHTGILQQQSQADYGTTMHNVSHAGHLAPNPPIKNPQSVHQTLIDLFTPPDDPSKPTRLSIVDAVRADANDLKRRLGAKDKVRIDAHLSGLADLEHKINALPPLCELPAQPTVTTDVIDGIVAINEAMSDLLAFCFSCDVTRVGSVLFVGGASEAPLVPNAGSQHGLSHSVSANALPYGSQNWKPDGPTAPPYSENGPIAQYNAGVVFTIKQLAYLLEKLKATPDAGNSNLLDNSVVYVSSDCSDGWAHDLRDMPILICGKAGGKLRSGIHFRDSNQRNASDVLLTVLQSCVPEATEVGSTTYLLEGEPDPAYSNTPVTELKAVT
jgi:hypothetical protein